MNLHFVPVEIKMTTTFYLVLVYLHPLLYNYVLKEFLLLCL